MNSFDHLNQFSAMLADLEQPGTGNLISLEECTIAFRAFRNAFLSAQRFIIPEAGNLILGEGTKYDHKHIELVHLPFDTIAVLYSPPPPARMQDAVDLAISLYAKDYPVRDFIADRGGGEDTVYCLSAWRGRETKRWHLSPLGLCIDLGASREHGAIYAYEVPAYPSTRLIESLRIGTGQHADNVATWEVGVLVDLCCGLACSNVKSELRRPPAALQASRARKGRKPLWDYHILTVSTAATSEAASADAGRASPRSHLRRGHIRRLGSGRIVWVQACMVRGQTPGIVAKDYAVLGNSAHS